MRESLGHFLSIIGGDFLAVIGWVTALETSDVADRDVRASVKRIDYVDAGAHVFVRDGDHAAQNLGFSLIGQGMEQSQAPTSSTSSAISVSKMILAGAARREPLQAQISKAAMQKAAAVLRYNLFIVMLLLHSFFTPAESDWRNLVNGN
jgi:hypothetical protein